ncbi:MAG TPA: DNA polymerase III subunit gamma/tau, partial [Chloroflexota bacterium]|nr:DNA polymerase III subunit gamma/tau [Chloroflexota bacterium]
MASVTLYNKWRPQTFADPERHPVIGQEHVTRTLRNAVARNQIAHAYLFCGPRGTGKTSAARILARAVNCRRGLVGEPCNECANCEALLSGRQLDLLIEIDGASNRGVDDVRQLRERLMQRPGGADLTGRYKVYIIDEVHMLTQEAFNALLKSLEEPPAHVIFVLATTDPQKVPATVASRCQRFDFKPIPLETLTAHLVHVARAEGVQLEDGAAELLARAAAGGARDAVSLLDQALAFAGAAGGAEAQEDGPPGALGLGGPVITAAQAQAMLGLTDFDAVCRLVDSIIARDLPTGLRLVHDVTASGVDLRQFARQVIEFLRALLLSESDAGTLLRLDDEGQEAIRQRARSLSLAQLLRLGEE